MSGGRGCRPPPYYRRLSSNCPGSFLIVLAVVFVVLVVVLVVLEVVLEEVKVAASHYYVWFSEIRFLKFLEVLEG